MKKTILLGAFLIAVSSLFAQNHRSVEIFAKQIQSVTKSGLSDAEQQKRIADMITDFMSNSQGLSYKLKAKNVSKELEKARKEKPMSKQQLDEYIKLQKESDALTGKSKLKSAPMSRSNVVATTEVAALNSYCTWALVDGQSHLTTPGHCTILPNGLDAYNINAAIINESAGPGSNNAVLLVPNTYQYSNAVWQNIQPVTGF